MKLNIISLRLVTYIGMYRNKEKIGKLLVFNSYLGLSTYLIYGIPHVLFCRDHHLQSLKRKLLHTCYVNSFYFRLVHFKQITYVCIFGLAFSPFSYDFQVDCPQIATWMLRIAAQISSKYLRGMSVQKFKLSVSHIVNLLHAWKLNFSKTIIIL